MPDVPDVDALELGKRILDIAALNSLPPSAFKEMGALTTQLADLARKATAANARADEAEAGRLWLAWQLDHGTLHGSTNTWMLDAVVAARVGCHRCTDARPECRRCFTPDAYAAAREAVKHDAR